MAYAGNNLETASGIAPVVLVVFNRPDTTIRILERIREARPDTLIVIADGPKPGRPEDQERCRQVREAVKQLADWKVNLLTHYAEENLGCRRRISSGITWALQQVAEAIILEDDCMPDKSFFRYATELLNHYRDDTRIGVVSGDNFQPHPMTAPDSYYFSRYNHCWGWATWQRAWKFYDDDMQAWPALRDKGWLEGLFPMTGYSEYWRTLFDAAYERRIDTWDYPWMFACWSQSLLTTLPRTNLVTNIGAGRADATHTRDSNAREHNLATSSLNFPLCHPAAVVADFQADSYTQRHIYGEAHLKTISARLGRLGTKIKRLPQRLRKTAARGNRPTSIL